MDPFHLEDEDVRAVVEAGRARRTDVGESVPATLSIEDSIAVYESEIPTAELRREAIARRGTRAKALETFAPLYLTNTCEAECKMCGMRGNNDDLERDTATPSRIREQLEVLRDRGVLAVALLTGEYRRETRDWSIGLTRFALETAVALGFRHVLINIGSLESDELEELLEGLERRGDGRVAPKVTMCTFQETYDRRAYQKFMGTDPENPRANFDRRLTNFDRAWEAGMRVVNPGVLLGLSDELSEELAALSLHIQHLLGSGLEVYVSVPRLRKATGAELARGVSDEDFVRLVAVLSMTFPKAKIVITTRESAEVQRQILPMVSVLSAGSSAVAPYTESGARFPLEASQFEVIDQRPIEAILAEWMEQGVRFENFDPAAGSPAL